MKHYFFIIMTALVLVSCGFSAETARTVLWDDGWLFCHGNISGAEHVSFNDCDWRTIRLPHDWAIEDIPGTLSPFDPTVAGGVASGFTRGGTAWYRKHFRLDSIPSDYRLSLLFDGVYMNSEVWINGRLAGTHFYGYTPFEIDISDFVSRDSDNVVAVRVNSENVTSRWYSGAGIYRHVHFIARNPLHIATWGTAVEADASGRMKVSSRVVNMRSEPAVAAVRLSVFNSADSLVAVSEKEVELPSGSDSVVIQSFEVEAPVLWSVNNPYIYTLHTEIVEKWGVSDWTDDNFGFRSIAFSPERGFLLNGEPLLMKGGCIHHDNGALGAKAFDRAEDRKIGLLKRAGFNAVRTAHNPPSKALLDACDRHGMLVIDEAFDVWLTGHFAGDYSSRFKELWRDDLQTMIVRDRNHPSVIMWSIGNEIKNNDTPEIAALAVEMADFTRSIDPTRPVTAGVNSVSKSKNDYLAALDVAGYNYSRAEYTKGHLRNPEQTIYASESYSKQAADYWEDVLEMPWVIGDFVWTAFDYIGEASIGWYGYDLRQDFYPWYMAYCGDIDVCGHRRPQSYYRESLWSDMPTVHISVVPPKNSFPLNPYKQEWSAWDWPDEVDSWTFTGYEGKLVDICVYTGCEESEVFVNGHSLGRKKASDCDVKNKFVWHTSYEPGKIVAIAYENEKPLVSDTLATARTPCELRLRPDRSDLASDGQDIVYVDIELVDKDGRANPEASDTIYFEVFGPGELIAFGNGNPMSTESFCNTFRKAWRGHCQAVVRSTGLSGDIILKARAGKLAAETIIKAN